MYKKLLTITAAIWIVWSNCAWSQEPPAAEKPAAAPSKPAATPAAKTGAGDDLTVEQARLADRFKRLEEVLGRLAELSTSSDPRCAKLLRDAISQSREQDVNTRFESIVKLLQDERLSVAATNQTELQKELDSLLTLLLKADRDRELSSQRERVRKYLKELDRIIRMQKGVRARTEGGDALPTIGEDQQHIANDTGKLGGDISKTDGEKKPDADDTPKPEDGDKPKSDDDEKSKSDEKQKPGADKADEKSKSGKDSRSGEPSKSGKPSDSGESQPSELKPKDGQPSESQPSKSGKPQPSDSPPSQGQPGQESQDKNEGQQQQQKNQPKEPADRAANRLRAAQQRMEEALKKLQETERKNASESQQKALKELEQAKAELERVLRQLREEEVERVLTQLVARFRKMLEMQTAIYDGTVKLDKVPEAQRSHDHEIEAARLSRAETQIVHEVDKALLLLHEEGSSVAFPEAIEQMRDDMRQVAERLAALKVETITQGLEKDIIGQLEETIAALEQSRKDLEKKRTPRGQQPAAGQPDDMSLVDKIAELKMIRSLQMRINKRTQRYGEMIQGEQAETPELLKALDGLADRQRRVYRATADLQQGRNE